MLIYIYNPQKEDEDSAISPIFALSSHRSLPFAKPLDRADT